MKKKVFRNLITEEQFWQIIEKSLISNRYTYSSQHNKLFNILLKKTEAELIGFWYHNVELYHKAYTSSLWAAAYIARGGCGDDSFHYFRAWLVSRGKEVYYKALEKPDSLVDEFKHYRWREDIETELLSATANEVYKTFNEKMDLLDLIDEEYEDDFINDDEMTMSQKIEFDWEEDDEESMRKICPNIFERYWNNPLDSKYSKA